MRKDTVEHLPRVLVGKRDFSTLRAVRVSFVDACGAEKDLELMLLSGPEVGSAGSYAPASHRHGSSGFANRSVLHLLFLKTNSI